MRVIGTAGHVDHGKSTLVRALTGIDPDRLKEEKAREMTIDLGFAHFDLPGVGEVSIIDVPGHRDFIENMLAGIGGIDAVLFVVAADEGIMPQTREHLAILDLLGIPAGVIALTKIDRVTDADWLELVKLDIAETTRGTILENAPLVPVSAKNKTGLDQLQAALRTTLAQIPVRPDRGSPRLSVDRVFSVSGFGTVVTGTVSDGCFTIGQEIELQPGGLRARIRGIQAHGQPRDSAEPGSRAALNLSGIEKRDVARGHLLTLPDRVQPTIRLDVQFRHLPDAPRPLRHNAEVKLFCGAAERMARVRLLNDESLPPGAAGWLQLILTEPMPLLKGDRFILRYPSPGTTIGGGTVIDTAPGKRWRRFRPEVINRLERLAQGDDPDREAFESAQQAMVRTLSGYHRAEPLRLGLSTEALRTRLKMERADFRVFLTRCIDQRVVQVARNGEIALPDHVIQFSATQAGAINRLLNAFSAAPYSPPSYKDSAAIVGEAVLRALIDRGDLVQVSTDVLFDARTFHELAEATRHILDHDGRISVKTLRDQFSTSRKYALALLEYFDQLRLTRRDGDDHVIGSGDWLALLDDDHLTG